MTLQAKLNAELITAREALAARENKRRYTPHLSQVQTL